MRRSWWLALAVCLTLVGGEAALAQDQGTAADVRVVELEADTQIRFTQDGEPLLDIPVVPGETVIFRIDNTAGFPHSFYIGTDEELREPYAMTGVGIPDWDSGLRELVWTVPEDIADLRFACTVPGHYYTMQGDFSETRLGERTVHDPFRKQQVLGSNPSVGSTPQA